jgi:hypothetical protein
MGKWLGEEAADAGEIEGAAIVGRHTVRVKLGWFEGDVVGRIGAKPPNNGMPAGGVEVDVVVHLVDLDLLVAREIGAEVDAAFAIVLVCGACVVGTSQGFVPPRI